MTKDDIGKLATPETDAKAFDWHPEDGKTKCVEGNFVDPSFARSLERKLAAAVMALEPLCRPASHGDGLAIPSIAQAKEARETLAAIREDK